ncbi:hypothetical protein LJC42_06325 [Eubacteriales bacterium OttesenSCG-928-K08]|nr:hypothetical protein [Eubacteriales bacterium OttesenSCG-928-K08]
MKVFQIAGNICHWDATHQFNSATDTLGMFPEAFVFVDAPDHVREGWGYDPTQEGENRFFPPTPPEGWLYDMETGTFHPDPDYVPPEDETEDMLAALELLGITPEEGGSE